MANTMSVHFEIVVFSMLCAMHDGTKQRHWKAKLFIWQIVKQVTKNGEEPFSQLMHILGKILDYNL